MYLFLGIHNYYICVLTSRLPMYIFIVVVSAPVKYTYQRRKDHYIMFNSTDQPISVIPHRVVATEALKID